MPEQIAQETELGEIFHEWSVEEYESHARGARWYLCMVGGGLLLIGYGLFSGNFLFSLVIVLFSIILYLQSHQQAQKIRFRISEQGIAIGPRLYTYSELDSFYVVYKPPFIKTLYLETKSSFRPLIRVNLKDTNPVDVRLTLLEFLPEDVEKEEEPLSDQMARNWKIH